MMNPDPAQHRAILQQIARRAMLAYGLLPDFSPAADAELGKIQGAPLQDGALTRDLRNLPWASIDNDDSMDLDQLTVAEIMPNDMIKILVAVANVDVLVQKGSAIDDHARQNTSSIYTPAQIFPMLPEKLSTDLTSLAENEDRLAIVSEMVFAADGSLLSSDIYSAHVRNQAKLAYNSVAAWLSGEGPAPDRVAADRTLAENLRVQDRVAQTLKGLRREHGALDLETIEARVIFEKDEIRDLRVEKKNRARELIEEFMIAANGVSARYLTAKRSPSFRRIVRSPKRWERIVEVAGQLGTRLPQEPDPQALQQFMAQRKIADPLHFPDLSLTIIKLLGNGEYAVEFPGEASAGHFGLAVKDYNHSTAPNRRFPDLITQRLIKVAITGSPLPYDRDELLELARHCTEKEDDVNKVERLVEKSAAAILLESRIGEVFTAIVTGASNKGTWVRLLDPPAEGRLVRGFEGVDVGDALRVRLKFTNVDKGYIDFVKAD
jgi:VacB/RNase II family 3'-5' exoribonuclease